MRYRWLRVTLILAAVSVLTALPAAPYAQAQGIGSNPDLSLWVSVGVGVLALLAAGLIVLRSVRSSRPGRRAPDPFIVFPVRGDVIPLGDAASPEPVAPAPAEPATPAPANRPAEEPVAETASPADVVDGQTIRFHRPPEGTLQLLPGRLEIVDGADQGQEIRFVRSRAGTPEITFGRNNGPPLQHIQLRASTVSRKHARMRFQGKQWEISNLSLTNPVVLNGEELPTGNGGRPLHEGDRIEMGEVMFRFREQ